MLFIQLFCLPMTANLIISGISGLASSSMMPCGEQNRIMSCPIIFVRTFFMNSVKEKRDSDSNSSISSGEMPISGQPVYGLSG